jgi:hypothetical protein
MSERFCTNCGTNLTAEAVFCHMCGASIQEVRGVPTAMPAKAAPSTVVAKQPEYVRPYRPIRQRPKLIGFFVGIVALFAVPLILMMSLGAINFTDLGVLDFEVTSLTHPNMDLEIDNDVGSLDITYDAALTKLMVATLEVRGRPGADINDAKNFISTVDGADHITVSFDSGDRGFWFWDKTVFNYAIDIRLHPSVYANYTVDTDTGSITLSTSGIDFLNFSSINMATNTGSVFMNLVGSTNTSIQEIELHSDTGRVDLNLGVFTYLNTDEVIVETDTGGISLTYEDLIVPGDIVWDVQTETGSITLSITQNLNLTVESASVFHVDTDTGSITGTFIFNSIIGFNIYADTATGSISLPGPGSYYENAAYSTATTLYRFTLTTDTGSVTATAVET